MYVIDFHKKLSIMVNVLKEIVSYRTLFNSLFIKRGTWTMRVAEINAVRRHKKPTGGLFSHI